jgi:hypothetical protein
MSLEEPEPDPDPDIFIKPEYLHSVTIKKQKNNTCYAHATTRTFCRTLQILNVFKSKDNEYFYKLFFTIIINKFKCNGGEAIETFYYLLDYLKDATTTINYDKLFNIDLNLTECWGEENKQLESEYIDH